MLYDGEAGKDFSDTVRKLDRIPHRNSPDNLRYRAPIIVEMNVGKLKHLLSATPVRMAC